MAHALPPPGLAVTVSITGLPGIQGQATTAPPLAQGGTTTVPPSADWQAAQAEAHALQAAVRRGRAELEQRIGPRGLTLGHITLPGGATVPIHATSPDDAKRLWRRLHLDYSNQGQRAAVVDAVREACGRWDAEAERCGLKGLERRAEGARERARNAARQHVAQLSGEPELTLS
ncbi:hypothetical protein [Roseomonas sp. BN140053]|uniref:hypothetical protein n=1 Tax=Roseomonas sp. BN140053 TaxID=3391898 RepID=UPI0039EC4A64